MLPVGKLRGACNPGCPTVAADGAFAAWTQVFLRA